MHTHVKNILFISLLLIVSFIPITVQARSNVDWQVGLSFGSRGGTGQVGTGFTVGADILLGNGSYVSIGGHRYWRPHHVATGWEPFQNGHWYEDPAYGRVWVSYDPWGEYTDHYGHWRYHHRYGWVWRAFADHRWAPHSVTFVTGYAGQLVWYPYCKRAFRRGHYRYGFRLGFRDGFANGSWKRKVRKQRRRAYKTAVRKQIRRDKKQVRKLRKKLRRTRQRLHKQNNRIQKRWNKIKKRRVHRRKGKRS